MSDYPPNQNRPELQGPENHYLNSDRFLNKLKRLLPEHVFQRISNVSFPDQVYTSPATSMKSLLARLYEEFFSVDVEGSREASFGGMISHLHAPEGRRILELGNNTDNIATTTRVLEVFESVDPTILSLSLVDAAGLIDTTKTDFNQRLWFAWALITYGKYHNNDKPFSFSTGDIIRALARSGMSGLASNNATAIFMKIGWDYIKIVKKHQSELAEKIVDPELLNAFGYLNDAEVTVLDFVSEVWRGSRGSEFRIRGLGSSLDVFKENGTYNSESENGAGYKTAIKKLFLIRTSPQLQFLFSHPSVEIELNNDQQ